MAKKKEKKTALVEATATEQKAPADNKLTIYEYENKYVKRQNARSAKFLVRFIATLIGLFLFAVLFFVSLDVYKINEYAGYAVGAVCLILYICLFIVPIAKLFSAEYFVTSVNAYSARAAQRHNRKVRHDIAAKMIDLTCNVAEVTWYDSEIVGKLAIALHAGKEEELKQCLTELYRGSVKKSARDLIFKSALKSAAYSAISQTATVDAALVVCVNLQLIKDLVFLYGFRPSDGRLLKIFGTVLANSLIAYGLGGTKIGTTVVKTMGDAVRGIPILGSAISAIVDSSVQGLTNGVLTAVIGYQTIRYLTKEYHLQDILDGVELAETAEEFEETCNEIETQLKKKKKKKEPHLAPAV